MSDERFAVQRTQITHVGRLRTTLMLTDIVGYSRRMRADEQQAIGELRKHNEIIRDLLEHHRGREVKTIGDAFLAEFAVADDALRCALAIHEGLGRAFSGADPLRVRIGLHVAEVEAIGPDVIGDGVNVLARIEPQAQPAGVCASREFLDELTVREVHFASIGPVAMKNLAEPMELYAWPPEHARNRETTMNDPDDPNRSRTSNSLPKISTLAAEELTQLNTSGRPAEPPPEGAPTVLGRPAAPPGGDEVTRALPPPSNARPLSKSSGIFAVPTEEPFAEQPTRAERGTFTLDLPDAASAPAADEMATVPRPRRSRPAAEPDDGDALDVAVRAPRRQRDPLVVVGLIAGAAVLCTALTIAWIVGRAGRSEPQTTVVAAPADPLAARPVQPPLQAAAPAPAPPAPVQPAPVATAPTAAAPIAPEPKAEVPVPRPKPAPRTLGQELAVARTKLRSSPMSAHKRRALLLELNKLDRKVLYARSSRTKHKAEAVLRSFMKKHKLL